MNRCGFTRGIARNASESRFPRLWQGLVAMYDPAVGIQGNRLIDFVANRTGLLTNGAAWLPGRRGRDLYFDGTDDAVDLQRSAYSLGIRRSATFMCWSRYEQSINGKDGNLISDFNGTSGIGLLFRNTTPYSIVFYVYPGNYRITFASSVTTNQYVHLAAVMDTTTIYLYVNGKNVANAALSGDVGSSGSTLKIGARGDLSANSWHNGRVSDVRIYNRALSAQEIMQSFAGASPLVMHRPPLVYKAASAAPVAKHRGFFSRF